MEPLEDVLRKVEELRNDLCAEIVVQEEIEDHFEEEQYGAYYLKKFWVDGQPRIAHPDTQKIEVARQVLQQIYDTSVWYSARFLAGRILDIDVTPQISLWLSKFRTELQALKYLDTVEENVYERQTVHRHVKNYYNECDDTEEDILVSTSQIEVYGVDQKRRVNATNDAASLFKLSGNIELRGFLIELYNLTQGKYLEEASVNHFSQIRSDEHRNKCKGSVSQVRSIAGHALGYPETRIFVHERPVTTAIMGLGTLSGLGYLVYEYLIK